MSIPPDIAHLGTGWLADREPVQPRRSERTFLLPPPAQASLVPWCPPLLAQQPYNNCVAHALLLAVETNKIKRGDYADGSFAYRSRLQLYYDQRERAGTTGTDSGATIADGLAVLSSIGVAKEPSWSYSSPLTTKPPAPVYTEAGALKLTGYAAVGFGPVPVKMALAAGHPVIVGLFLKPSFLNTGAGGVVPMPAASETTFANHVVCLVGYGDYPGYFTFANSWGTSWGEGGFGYLPEAVVGNAAFSASYYAITDQD